MCWQGREGKGQDVLIRTRQGSTGCVDKDRTCRDSIGCPCPVVGTMRAQDALIRAGRALIRFFELWAVNKQQVRVAAPIWNPKPNGTGDSDIPDDSRQHIHRL